MPPAISNPFGPGEIELVSWDVDGTLYDLRRMMRAMVWLGVRGLLGAGAVRNVRELRRLARFRSAMARVRARGGALAGELPADRAELLELERRWYGRAIARVGPRPDAVALLDRFTAAGVRQIVVSDYRADYKLALLGLTDRFDRLYAGEDLGHLKPSPGIFTPILADLAIPPSRILHIGDRPDRDAAAAHPHGLHVHILGRPQLR